MIENINKICTNFYQNIHLFRECSYYCFLLLFFHAYTECKKFKYVIFLFQRYGLKCDLNAGEYQVVPYTTGCRFKQRTPNEHVREAKLVKKDKDDKIVITSAFRYCVD